MSDEKLVELPPGLVCTILHSGTYLTGSYDFIPGQIFMADEMTLGPDMTLKLYSTLPRTTVTTDKGVEVTGYLRDANNVTITLVQDNGNILNTKYTSYVTSPYDIHTLYTNEPTRVQLRLRYDNGMDWAIISRVIASDEKGYTIQQQLRVTNNLPYDLLSVKDLLISFQGRARPGSNQQHKSSTRLVASARMAPISETVMDEVSAPVRLGPVEFIPKHSSITLIPFAPVTLKIVDIFTDISLGDTRASITLSLSPMSIIYPSTVQFIDANTQTPTASFSVGLQQPSSIFETSLGTTTTVTVLSSETTDTGYRIEVINTSDRDQKLRFSGWELKGRKDVAQIKKGETKIYTGRLPEEAHTIR